MNRRALFAAAVLAPALAVAGAAQAAGAPAKKKGGGPSFTQIPTLTATLVRADGRRGVLTVEAGVDATDPALGERIVALQPRLRDAYNTAVARFAATLRPGYAPDADRLANELQTATDRVVGKKGAKLLLGTIILN